MITTKRLKISVSLIIFIVILANNICFANIDDDEVIDINEIKKETIEAVSKNTEELKLNSKIGLIFDRNSKTILYEKNGLKQVPMASTTKIMTAIVVLENANLDDLIKKVKSFEPKKFESNTCNFIKKLEKELI